MEDLRKEAVGKIVAFLTARRKAVEAVLAAFPRGSSVLVFDDDHDQQKIAMVRGVCETDAKLCCRFADGRESFYSVRKVRLLPPVSETDL